MVCELQVNKAITEKRYLQLSILNSFRLVKVTRGINLK